MRTTVRKVLRAGVKAQSSDLEFHQSSLQAIGGSYGSVSPRLCSSLGTRTGALPARIAHVDSVREFQAALQQLTQTRATFGV